MNEQLAEKYAEQLMSYTKIGVAVIAIVFIVFIVLFFVCLKVGNLKEKSVIIALIAILLIAPIVYFTSVFPYQIDIKQQTYETYQGEFYIEDYYYATRSGTYILIKREGEATSARYKAPSDLTEIEPNHTYTGEFVIATHSKVLVDMTIDKN